MNSYKRLMPAWDAPVYTVWSQRSANALVRVPPPIDGPPVLEIRSPDSACNPYLALAVLIEAVADGIRSRTLPGDPFTGSTYDLREKYRKDHGIRTLPHSLGEAIDALDERPRRCAARWAITSTTPSATPSWPSSSAIASPSTLGNTSSTSAPSNRPRG